MTLISIVICGSRRRAILLTRHPQLLHTPPAHLPRRPVGLLQDPDDLSHFPPPGNHRRRPLPMLPGVAAAGTLAFRGSGACGLRPRLHAAGR